jgi:hypothetical protein
MFANTKTFFDEVLPFLLFIEQGLIRIRICNCHVEIWLLHRIHK